MKSPYRPYSYIIAQRPLTILVILFVTLVSAFLISKGIKTAAISMVLPFIFIFLDRVINNAYVGLMAVFVINHFALGIIRYVPAPLGLSVDGLLMLTYIALFIKYFYTKVDFSPAKNVLTWLSLVWYAYIFFELVNPQAVSRVAWFYAMRGLGLYMLLSVPLTFMLWNRYQDVKLIIRLWGFFSILATLKGMMQLFVGVDPFEQAWLDKGGHITHILFGKLRIFSFFSDAGQFGAAQGHTGVTFGIIALSTKEKKWRYFYWLVSVMGLYGMMISGTRGAIAVPGAGAMLFIILRKDLRIIISGGLVLLSLFIFFKHTTILNSNYQIRRIRTAFDPNNPSLQVRLENQRKLKSYMSNKPFGGGVGSSGSWGLRFSPHTFLANTPTDSWYVMVWVELGVVGLLLHLFILFYVLARGSLLIMFKIKDPELKGILSGLAAGMFGIMVASYGNGILGQMPTGILIYTSMAFMFMGEKFDREIAAGQPSKSIA